MDQDQLYQLKWHNHCTNFITIFSDLYEKGCLTDVTLCTTDGPPIKCHRIVLAACSPYFHEMFIRHAQEPAMCVFQGIKHAEVKAILNYIYTGQCEVKHSMLNRILEAATDLRIKGLVDETKLHPNVREPMELLQSPPAAGDSNNLESRSITNGIAGNLIPSITNGIGGNSISPPALPAYNFLYGQNPIDPSQMSHLWNHHSLLQAQYMAAHQPTASNLAVPRSHASHTVSSYENATETSPLSKKKKLLANQEMPILKDALARTDELESEQRRQDQYTNGNGSDRRESAESVAKDNNAHNSNGVSPRGHRAEKGRASTTGKNSQEWKRYKQYSREDIASAMSAVKDKRMSALQAARQFSVPSRTLYDKLKKAGILPSRNAVPKREPSSANHLSSARFPYHGELNGSVYGPPGSWDAHSENEFNGSSYGVCKEDAQSEDGSDIPNDHQNDSAIFSEMLHHAAASREQRADEYMAMDMSTHSSSSPSSSSRHRSDSGEEQVEDLSVNRVPSETMSILRTVNCVSESSRGPGSVKDEPNEQPTSPA